LEKESLGNGAKLFHWERKRQGIVNPIFKLVKTGLGILGRWERDKLGAEGQLFDEPRKCKGEENQLKVGREGK